MIQLTVVDVDGIVVRSEEAGSAVQPALLFIASETARKVFSPEYQRFVEDLVIYGRAEMVI